MPALKMPERHLWSALNKASYFKALSSVFLGPNIPIFFLCAAFGGGRAGLFSTPYARRAPNSLKKEVKQSPCLTPFLRASEMPPAPMASVQRRHTETPSTSVLSRFLNPL